MVVVVITGPVVVVVVDEENRGMTTSQTEEKVIVNVIGTGMDVHLATIPTEIVIVMIVGLGIGRGTAGIRIAVKRGIGIDHETGTEVGRGIGGMRVGIVIVTEGTPAIGILRGGGRECSVPGGFGGRMTTTITMLDPKRSCSTSSYRHSGSFANHVQTIQLGNTPNHLVIVKYDNHPSLTSSFWITAAPFCRPSSS
jgi:hypothetical protein